MFIVIGAVISAGAAGVFVVWWFHPNARRQENLPLAGTVLLSLGVLALVTGWVLADRAIDRGEALKTGGLAAASVVALYALWLNDRRRRVEENRHEIERRRQDLEYQRTEHDRERVADERFARAVELLGNDADQVRVGALHALAGLARSRPAYTQTVLDVLCSYLRRPFDHGRYAAIRGEAPPDEYPEDRDKRGEADRWLQVRMTAQRLVADLLPLASENDPPRYDLDLHGATLEYFDISHRVIGQLRAREANLYESTSLRGTHVHGPAWFTGARCWGRLYAPDMVFHDRSWFSQFHARGIVDLARTEFLGDTKFANSEFHDRVSFHDAVFARNIDFTSATFHNAVDLRIRGGATARTHAMTVSLAHEHELPAGWQVDATRDEMFGLVRA